MGGNKAKRIGIYTPYPDILGGGERYIMSVAECLSQNKNSVDLFWDKPEIIDEIAKRFNLDLDRVKVVSNIFHPEITPFTKWRVTKKYDVFFFVSDGSLPLLFSKKNIIHFQIPLINVNGRGIVNRYKLSRIHQTICNSCYTKKYIDQEFGLDGRVIYPPVDVNHLKPGKKMKMILSVGRLGEPNHSKKQEVLIDCFKQMIALDKSRLLKGWKLVLVGGVKKGEEVYVDELKRLATGLPVEFIINADFQRLVEVYGQARIFWHAAGFGEDETKHPENLEHFGMVVVEAMASGCVPVVIGRGGIKETVAHGQNGLLWKDRQSLIKYTFDLIKSKDLWEKYSRRAVIDSQKFSKDRFCRQINELVKV